MKPEKSSHPPYFENYISKVSEDDVHQALHNNFKQLMVFFSSIQKEKENHAYAPGKWTIKQVLNHIIDCERIFAYRALRFARKDPQLVAAFEEDDYAKAADVSHRTLTDLLQEFEYVRLSTIALFTSFNQETLLRSGQMASGKANVLSLGFIVCGHANHHVNVIKEKYL